MNIDFEIAMHLKHKSSALCLLLSTQFKMFASFQRQLGPSFALCALQPQNYFLCGLCLLAKDRFGLATVTRLLAIIPSFPLRYQRGLAGLVLRDLVLSMLSAVFAFAVCPACFWYIHHGCVVFSLRLLRSEGVGRR